MEPGITVCIVTYNQGEMLRGAIQSVLSQTYRDMKVVVLDDASPDSASEIVASFDDPRLKYIRHDKNIGALANWNYAIDCADTEYVNIFHGDDRMFPWMIEKLVGALDENEKIGIAACTEGFVMGSADIPKKRRETGGKHYKAMDYVRQYAQVGSYSIVPPSATFRKKLIDGAGIRYRLDVGPGADAYLILEANGNGMEMLLIDEPLMEYRQHETSWTNRSGFDVWFDSLCKLEELTSRFLPEMDMSHWRAQNTKWLFDVIFGARDINSSCNPNQAPLDDIGRMKEAIMKQGWFTRESELDKCVLRSLVREFLKLVGSGRCSLSDYRARRRGLRELKFKIPPHREIMWFIEYVLLKN
jgi:glycosyltransferase involved in cell wall biosynthesis